MLWIPNNTVTRAITNTTVINSIKLYSITHTFSNELAAEMINSDSYMLYKRRRGEMLKENFLFFNNLSFTITLNAIH